jgi:hypothetical protein
VHFVRQGDGWKIARIKHDFQWVSGNNALFDMTEPNLAENMRQVFVKPIARPLWRFDLAALAQR